MKPRRLLPLTAALNCFFTVSAHAGDVFKDNNTNNLNLGTSWSGGTAPGSGDVAVWNNAVTAANATVLGANTSWQGIKIVNPTGLVTINNGNTLTLGSSGIDIASTSAGLSIRTAVTLGANQSFVIGNSSAAQDLLFDSPSSGLAFNMGGFTVGTSGAGTMRFTSGHTISNGTFNLDNANSEFQSGGGRTITLNNDVTLNLAAGKQLTFAINSAPGGGLAVSSAAAINISGGTLQINSSGAAGTNRMEQTGKVSFTGTSTVNNASAFGYFTNFSGEIALAGTTTWNSTGSSTANTTISGPLTGNGTLNYRGTSASHRTDLSGDNSAFTGIINLDGGSGGRNLRLTTATAGSASATWAPSAGNILQVDGVAVNLGTLNGAGTVTNSHASNVAAITVGAGTFSGAITNGTPLLGMSLTKNTAGILTLSGNGSTFTGNTLISGGKLVATQTGALSTSSAISVNGSGAIFDGTGSYGSVTVADNLGTVQNGNATSGALTLSSLNFNGDGTLNIVTSSATPSARVIVTGALTTTPGGGTITVNGSGSWSNGVNNLLSYGSGGALLSDFTAGTFTGFTSRQSSGGLSLSGNNLFLTVNGDSPKWTGSDNGNWVVGTTGANGNWKLITAATQTDFIANDIVLFDDTAPGTKTVNVSTANVSVASAEFNNSSSNYTLTGGFGVSAGTITKNGSGSLTIENANSTSGGVQLIAGTLNVNNNSALGSGALTIAGGTTLDNTSGSAKVATNTQNWNGDFTFTGTNDLTLGAATMNASRQVTVNAGTLTVGGISGSGLGLTKAGSGTLAVGVSSYSGATAVNAGTLKATSTTSFTTTSSVTLANTAGVTLDLNGNSQTISSLTGGGTTGGNVVLGGATLTTGIATDTTIGALSGAGGLVKANTGRLSILGDTTGFTGSTTISGGVLDVGNVANFLGASGTLTMSNGSVLQGSGTITRTVGTGNAIVSGNGGFAARGGQLDVDLDDPATVGASFFNLNGGGNAFGNGLVLGSASADSKVRILSSIGINNFNGNRTINVNPGTGTASAELAGVVSNGASGGNNGINKTGNGDLILSAANTITGSTTINAGRIVLGHNQALQFTSLDTGNAGSVSATGFTTPSIGGLTGSVALGTFISSGYSGITTLTLAPQTGRSLTYAGVIADGAAGMNLVKSGAGIQTLNGVNTYTGSTTINGGTLALGVSGSIDDTTGVSLGTNGTFDVSAKPGGYTVDNLTGSGDVIGSLTVSTQLAIGNSPGTIDVTGNLTLGVSSTFVYEMIGGGGSADLGNVSGTLSFGSNVILDLVELGTYTVGNKFTLFGYGTGISGTFLGLSDDSSFLDDLNNEWVINYDDTSAGLNGGSGSSFVTITAVPEPGAALLGGLGLLALLRRRRQS